MISRYLPPPIRRRRAPIPYDMFSVERTQREADAARHLERVYHKGQDKIWAGHEVLADLVAKHGKPDVSPEVREALGAVFSVILWGELAAWKVSAELALQIEPLEAKLAATSQAHDESRHFYVMYEYLKLLGVTPGPLPPAASALLSKVLAADSLAKKLVGMQLMVEPIALTIFQMVRESQIEPVLCGLLPYYERDEARHVALGIHYLPHLIRDMDMPTALSYWAWQARMFWYETRGLGELERSFRTLGFAPRDAFRLGQGKQLYASQQLVNALGFGQPILHAFRMGFDFLVVWKFGEDGEDRTTLERLRAATHAAFVNEAEATNIEPAAAPG